ncbi:aspartate:alanine exchanger family transporter [Trueperella bialowiezensis]|uniref:Putative transporter n=1 Tax=Trueperella bialowiezensis TaxID=312285 RepID=A0A3S4UZZ9_9ACTO|nr:TrkA C-terminal domain-containing protein [Trueperella bialowiezensis]VEI13995.1 putative transporter [Trueperella bialowiezensis]
MEELLTSSPLMTLFLVVALGGILGIIPFGKLKFGAAGALFVGLFIGNIAPELGESMALVQSLGLALFVYMVGLSAGQTFFHDLKKHYKIMFAAVGAIALAAVATVVVGPLFGLTPELSVGVFAGSLTNTPGLAAATAVTGTAEPGVGYSLGYPMGVFVGIVAVSLIVSRRWPEPNDTPSYAGQSLTAVTAVVENSLPVRQIPGWQEQLVRASYLYRNGRTRVVSPGEELEPEDQIVIVGMDNDVKQAVDAIGHAQPEHLADDRSRVDFRAFIISDKDLAGQTVAELNMPGRFGAVITRIHRGDFELLASDFERLEIGDRVMVAFPRSEHQNLEKFFGNSERTVSQVDAVALGLGMVLGLLLGMVEVSLPGGGTFSLGSAAGPLIVGMILGYLRRTGPLVWQLPMAANETIRQLGLLLFLAAVGIASGPAFVDTAFSMTGLRALAVGAIIAIIVLAVIAVAGRLLGVSAQRTAGTMAGAFGQPAILSYAQAKENDERIESGYASVFALAMIIKILLVYVILAV